SLWPSADGETVLAGGEATTQASGCSAQHRGWAVLPHPGLTSAPACSPDPRGGRAPPGRTTLPAHPRDYDPAEPPLWRQGPDPPACTPDSRRGTHAPQEGPP